MKAEVFITINWNGPYGRGEAAVAIVLKAVGDPRNFFEDLRILSSIPPAR